MSNYNFPTVGSTNWGVSLNNILKNMDARLTSVETATLSEQDKSITIAPIASGCVCDSAPSMSFTYDTSNHKLTLTLNQELQVYVSGNIHNYFKLDNKTTLDCSSRILESNKFYYVYLKYIDATTWNLWVDNKLLTSPHYLLINNIWLTGSATINQGHKYFKTYSTPMQRVDSNTRNSIVLNGPINNNSTSSSSIFNIGDVKYIIKAEGYYIDTSNTTDNETEQIDFNRSYIYVEYTDEGLKPTTVKTVASVGRLLLTISGQMIVQYAKDVPLGITLHQLYYDLSKVPFVTLVDSAWGAADAVEVARFYYNGYNLYITAGLGNPQIAQFIDSKTSWMLSNPITGGGQTLYFEGFTNNSTILTSHTTFGANTTSTAVYLMSKDLACLELNSYASLTFNTNSKLNLATTESSLRYWYNNLIMNTSGISLYTSKTGIILNNNSITLGCGATYTAAVLELTSNSVRATTGVYIQSDNYKLNAGGAIDITSDRRLKNSFTHVNNLSNIVENIDVYNYYFNGNDNKQIGIVAQDLERYDKDNLFVSTNKTENFDDEKHINENRLVYILWGALHEEIDKRKVLEERLSKLEGGQ